jgi:predicted RNA-binding Zn-ribbon protein involved in translation (DUF1610 family)
VSDNKEPMSCKECLHNPICSLWATGDLEEEQAHKYCFGNFKNAKDFRKPEEGKWIYKYEGKDIAYCSICNFYVQDKINNVAYCYHYCPNCGAKMKGSV